MTPFLSPHPLCGGGDLLFLLSPPFPAAAAAFCFCSHSKTPARIIFLRSSILGVISVLLFLAIFEIC